MKPKTLVEHIAGCLAARQSLQARASNPLEGDKAWIDRWEATIDELAARYLPRGAGFDSGSHVAPDSTPDKIGIITAFHHMDEHGFYDGWTEHRVTVRPSFVLGALITVSGPDRNGIKDYIASIFFDALTQEVDV